MHPRTSVRIEVFLQPNFVNGLSHLHFFGFRFARTTADKPLVRRTRHVEDSTEHRDRPSIAMLADKPQPQLLSLAKNAVAFFKMSRSILS